MGLTAGMKAYENSENLSGLNPKFSMFAAISLDMVANHSYCHAVMQNGEKYSTNAAWSTRMENTITTTEHNEATYEAARGTKKIMAGAFIDWNMASLLLRGSGA